MPMLILLNPLKHGDRDVTYLFSTEMSGIEEFPDDDEFKFTRYTFYS